MGRKEYDLISELGRGNWLDAMAGEAVLIGLGTRTPELEAMGTQLAALIREVPYDHDEFYKVEAAAIALQAETDRVKRECVNTVRIDKTNSLESLGEDFDLELTEAGGLYEICISVYKFYGDHIFRSRVLEKLKLFLDRYRDTPLDDCVVEITEQEMGPAKQKFINEIYRSPKRKLQLHVVIHEHEEKDSMGMEMNFPFDDFAQAIVAWKELKGLLFQVEGDQVVSVGLLVDVGQQYQFAAIWCGGDKAVQRTDIGNVGQI